MQHYTTTFHWIKKHQESMTQQLIEWVNINSWSENPTGLAKMHATIETAFGPLGGEMSSIPLPPLIKIDSKGQIIEHPHGRAFRMTKHRNAPIQVLLGGHMDTVYPQTSPFQQAQLLDKNTLQGPGAADMKGGLIVLLTALKALEKSPFAGKIGWEVLINPDEELGSDGSESLFRQSARHNDLGLLFEPSFPDGAMVTARKGSANFTVVAKGRAAHAGRDFHSGRSAISAIVRFITEAEKLNDHERGITVNVGQVEGGGPVNIVPDLAICRLNLRMVHEEDLEKLRKRLYEIIATGHEHDGISLTLHEQTSRPPKSFNNKNEALFQMIQSCANSLDFSIEGRPSGGVCDGNLLSAEGLPTIDTLGVVGGNIHTTDEYVLLNSLTERTILVTLLLMRLANGELKIDSLKEEK